MFRARPLILFAKLFQILSAAPGSSVRMPSIILANEFSLDAEVIVILIELRDEVKT
jgi:hypothetical protein